jgi:hypothetical protein
MTTTITIPEPAATDSRQRRPQRGRDQAWLEWEALRWGVPVEIERADLQRLVEASTVLLEREKHRLIHGSDWQRWGRRGGLATLRRYGTSWYSALALKRWGRLDAEDLERARVVGQGLPTKDA